MIAQLPTLDQLVKENSHDIGSLLQTIRKEMSDHLKRLETSMHHYFPESDQETASLEWIIHPFSLSDEATIMMISLQRKSGSLCDPVNP